MNNKRVIIITIAVIISMIIISTIYKVHVEHNNRLIEVVEKEFYYYAKECFLKDECDSIVTLKDLYEKEYLEDKLTNPINKKYYSDKSSVNINTKKINLIS